MSYTVISEDVFGEKCLKSVEKMFIFGTKALRLLIIDLKELAELAVVVHIVR